MNRTAGSLPCTPCCACTRITALRQPTCARMNLTVAPGTWSLTACFQVRLMACRFAWACRIWLWGRARGTGGGVVGALWQGRRRKADRQHGRNVPAHPHLCRAAARGDANEGPDGPLRAQRREAGFTAAAAAMLLLLGRVAAAAAAAVVRQACHGQRVCSAGKGRRCSMAGMSGWKQGGHPTTGPLPKSSSLLTASSLAW